MIIKLNEPQRQECIRYVIDCFNGMRNDLQIQLNLPYIKDINNEKSILRKIDKIYELGELYKILENGYGELQFEEKELDCENFIWGVLCLAMLGFSSTN